MEFSAKQIAQMLQGTVVGDENAVVSKLCKIEEGEKGGLSFLANSKYNQYIYDTEASIVIVNEDFEPEQTVKTTMIKVKDAYSCFAQLLEVYNAYRLNKTLLETPMYHIAFNYIDKTKQDYKVIDKAMRKALAKIFVMLLGKNFRRYHKRSLHSIFICKIRRCRCNRGFTRADITLNNSVHRTKGLHIRCDFINNAPLRGGQRKRK